MVKLKMSSARFFCYLLASCIALSVFSYQLYQFKLTLSNSDGGKLQAIESNNALKALPTQPKTNRPIEKIIGTLI